MFWAKFEVFGTSLEPSAMALMTDGEIPLTDSTNLLGPSSLVGIVPYRVNYGTNSPMPNRRQQTLSVAPRDSFRRHSAHGRICSQGTKIHKCTAPQNKTLLLKKKH